MTTQKEKKYRVINVTQRIQPTSAGTFQRYVEVTYQATRGFTSSVSIPEMEANVDAIRAAIEADLARIEAIYNL